MGSDEAGQQAEAQAMTTERLRVAMNVVRLLATPGVMAPETAQAILTVLAEVERQRDELNALAEKLDAETDYSAGRIESLAKRCAGQRHRAHVAEAEVERLRAREAALMEVVRAVADGQAVSVDEDMWCLRLSDLRHSYVQTIHEQARALLASTAEAETGEPHEQAAQGEA